MRIPPTPLILLVAAAAIGCHAHKLESVDLSQVEDSKLAFLEDGETSREVVYRQLGRPSGNFEQDRILTYRLDDHFNVAHSEKGPGSTRIRYLRARFSLVLVFDDQGVLERHRVLQVR